MTTCTTRTDCAGCGLLLPPPFLDLGKTPLADRYPKPGELEEMFPLRVAVCNACSLVQLLDIVEDSELFGWDYGFTTASSPALVAYYAEVARELLFTYPHNAERGVLEIGCNDGTLLEQFSAQGCPVLGVEPSAAHHTAIHKAAVFPEPFSKSLASRITTDVGLILAFNVAAHMADPHEFFGGLSVVMDRDTVAVVEFQYVGDLLNGCLWDQVYHEHRFFYGLTTFAQLAAQHGLAVTGYTRTLQQGGSLRVTLERIPSDNAIGGLFEPGESALSGNDLYRGFQSRVDYSVNILRHLVMDEAAKGRLVAGFGATAKSCTLLNYANISQSQVRWVEDLTLAKAGRCIPGRGIPIITPADRPEPPDTYLMLGWNYLSRAMSLASHTWPRADFRYIIPGGVPTIV